MGDLVNVKNFGHGPKWLPGEVVKISGPVSYEIKLDDERVVRRHIDHMHKRQVSERSRSYSPHRKDQGILDTPIMPVPMSGGTLPVVPHTPVKSDTLPVPPGRPPDTQPQPNAELVTSAPSQSVPVTVSTPPLVSVGQPPPTPTTPLTPVNQQFRKSVRDRKPPSYLKDFAV